MRKWAIHDRQIIQETKQNKNTNVTANNNQEVEACRYKMKFVLIVLYLNNSKTSISKMCFILKKSLWSNVSAPQRAKQAQSKWSAGRKQKWNKLLIAKDIIKRLLPLCLSFSYDQINIFTFWIFKLCEFIFVEFVFLQHVETSLMILFQWNASFHSSMKVLIFF